MAYGCNVIVHHSHRTLLPRFILQLQELVQGWVFAAQRDTLTVSTPNDEASCDH
jgi:hypothetical protein